MLEGLAFLIFSRIISVGLDQLLTPMNRYSSPGQFNYITRFIMFCLNRFFYIAPLGFRFSGWPSCHSITLTRWLTSDSTNVIKYVLRKTGPTQLYEKPPHTMMHLPPVSMVFTSLCDFNAVFKGHLTNSLRPLELKRTILFWQSTKCAISLCVLGKLLLRGLCGTSLFTWE